MVLLLLILRHLERSFSLSNNCILALYKIANALAIPLIYSVKLLAITSILFKSTSIPDLAAAELGIVSDLKSFVTLL